MNEQLPAAAPSRRARKRDERIRRMVRQLRLVAPHLDRPEYAAVLRGFAMVSITLERSYAALRDRDVMSSKTDELRSSIDVIGRLVGQQAKLAAALGLVPAVMGKLKTKTVDLAGAIADAEVVGDD